MKHVLLERLFFSLVCERSSQAKLEAIKFAGMCIKIDTYLRNI
jgi:hypothetical protein